VVAAVSGVGVVCWGDGEGSADLAGNTIYCG
jgi:hypothetical protein